MMIGIAGIKLTANNDLTALGPFSAMQRPLSVAPRTTALDGPTTATTDRDVIMSPTVSRTAAQAKSFGRIRRIDPNSVTPDRG
jgi:hypothetical protein